MISQNILVGITIVIINLVPFIIKKPKYLFLTTAISLFLAIALIFLNQ